MIGRLLIANRGEIAVRIIRTARALGITAIAVYSDADRDALHVAEADEAFHIGPAAAAASYLDQPAILGAARRAGADAIHPGYGFLSENPEFAAAVVQAGLVFVGPPAGAMRLMGLKDEAKRLMRAAGVPVVPGYDGEDQSPERLAAEAARVGYPVLVKPVAGGGGRGMRLIAEAGDFSDQLAAARREAAAGFGDDRVLIEKHLPAVRHIEVQVMADRFGTVLHLWERDCSAQRRHQKVIEEAPAPGLPPALRHALCAAAVTAARQVGYVGAGTVEFLVPVALDGFYFIEMNTRLQVEHPVTEMVTGLDLVALQLRAAAGESLGLTQEDIPCHGHAIEARLYAEDPALGFRPQTGRITALGLPAGEGVRTDTGVRPGDQVTAHYDAMIAKLIVHAPTRAAAVARLQSALARSAVAGPGTNLGFLGRLAGCPDFRAGRVDTGLIDRSLPALTDTLPPPPPVLAAAALAAEGWLDAAAGPSPFDRLKGFTLWGREPRHHRLHCDGRDVDATLAEEAGRFTLSGLGAPFGFTLQRVELPEIRLFHDGEVLRLVCHRDTYGLTTVFEGVRYRFTASPAAADDPAAAGSRRLLSPVPGRLAKHLVAPGAMVSTGQPVAVIEAMKTEFLLRAEASGSVLFHAAEGVQVKEGDVIAELGEADG